MNHKAEFAAMKEQLEKVAAEMGVRPEHLSDAEKAVLLKKARELLVKTTGYRPKALDKKHPKLYKQ